MLIDGSEYFWKKSKKSSVLDLTIPPYFWYPRIMLLKYREILAFTSGTLFVCGTYGLSRRGLVSPRV